MGQPAPVPQTLQKVGDQPQSQEGGRPRPPQAPHVGSARSFEEVIDVGALEAVQDRLTASEYAASVALRQLWPAGTLNPASVSSPLTRLGMSRSSFYDHDDDERLAAHDALRAAVRSMGYMGMSG